MCTRAVARRMQCAGLALRVGGINYDLGFHYHGVSQR